MTGVGKELSQTKVWTAENRRAVVLLNIIFRGLIFQFHTRAWQVGVEAETAQHLAGEC